MHGVIKIYCKYTLHSLLKQYNIFLNLTFYTIKLNHFLVFYKHIYMNILIDLIYHLTPNEVRIFKTQAQNTYHKNDTKCIELFEKIRKTKQQKSTYNENAIAKQLYPNASNKNAFYRLKNLLLDEVSKNLFIQNIEKQKISKIFYYISQSIFFGERNKSNIALYFIKKAEKKALETENIEILDFIYNQYIKISVYQTELNPQQYIEKRAQNAEKLNDIREIDQTLAMILYEVRTSQNFSDSNTVSENLIVHALQKSVEKFTNNKELKNSKILRFRLYEAISATLLKKQDFVNLEHYLLDTYHQFLEYRLFDKSNHATKLRMLIYLINALFKNQKYNDSLKYTNELQVALQEYDSVLYNKFLFFYYNSLVINYSMLDKKQAVKILVQVEKEDILKKDFYSQFIYLNLAVLFFDLKKYDDAGKQLIKLYLHDWYKQADTVLKLKINIMELLILFQLQDFEVLEYRSMQVKKSFLKYLKMPEYEAENAIIELFDIALKNITGWQKSEKFWEKIQTMEAMLLQKNEGRQVVKYLDFIYITKNNFKK